MEARRDVTVAEERRGETPVTFQVELAQDHLFKSNIVWVRESSTMPKSIARPE